MYSYVWPVSLPDKPETGYSETGGVHILRTAMDAGPAKQRKRGSRVQELSVSYRMTTAQVAIFEAFVKDTLKGTARYGLTSPRTLLVDEVRIVPESGGGLYTITYEALDWWTVSLKLEVLP